MKTILYFVIGLLLTFAIMGIRYDEQIENGVAPISSDDVSIDPETSGQQDCGATSDLAWQLTCWRESENDVYAHNKSENSKGIAQIKKIMVDDVNRIIRLRRIVPSTAYVHDDAYDPIKAREMFDIFQWYYCPNGTPEQQYRKWNRGP